MMAWTELEAAGLWDLVYVSEAGPRGLYCAV